MGLCPISTIKKFKSYETTEPEQNIFFVFVSVLRWQRFLCAISFKYIKYIFSYKFHWNACIRYCVVLNFHCNRHFQYMLLTNYVTGVLSHHSVQLQSSQRTRCGFNDPSDRVQGASQRKTNRMRYKRMQNMSGLSSGYLESDSNMKDKKWKYFFGWKKE